MDHQLSTQLLPAVPHFAFSIFNVAWPNLVAWTVAIVVFFAAAWARMPRLFERVDTPPTQTSDAPNESGHESH